LGVTPVRLASLAVAVAAAASVVGWGPWWVMVTTHQWSQWSDAKFGQLILGKIVEIVATRSHI